MHKVSATYRSKNLLTAFFVAAILSLGAMSQSVLAQSTTSTSTTNTQSTTGGPLTTSPMSTTGDVNDMGPGTSSDIEKNYYLRMRSGLNFAATQYGGSDVIQNGQSMGPGSVMNATSGPIQVWPAFVAPFTSKVPTFRDQGISKNLFRTFGYPVSDTQFQVISRYNDNILLEQMFNPERAMWMTNAIGNLQATKTANNTANLAQNQATSAIEHIEVFLTNFTNESADPGGMWHQLLNNLFIPIAILLLLVGAVVAQVVAIAAQGTSILGNISPFDGLQRSVIAIFLIPFTQLIMSWGIDVANSISLSIPTAYYTQFGRDMYQDAICAQKKAFPVQQANNNLNAIIPFNSGANTTAGTIEGMDFDILGGWNPCQTAIPTSGTNLVPDEAEQFVMTSSRLMCNMGNSTLAITWNVLCAFQTAYLYYLWCMGPIVAALWVWPMQQLRNALPSWIDGLITLCFWSLFWNTSVLLMACFYGVNTNGDTGTMYMSALNLLANLSVKFAFNFSGLSTSLGFMAESMMMQAAGAAGGGGGQKGGAGAGASHGAMPGGHTMAHGGPFGHHMGAGAFVPGQGQPGAETPGSTGTGISATGTAASGAGAVGAGGLAITPAGSTAGLGVGTDTTAGGALTGTGFGTGLGPASSEAVGGSYFPGSGQYEVGAAGGGLTPALSGTAAPGGIGNTASLGFNPDPTGLAAAGSATGTTNLGELNNPGVSPIEAGAVGAMAGAMAANANANVDLTTAGAPPLDASSSITGSVGVGSTVDLNATGQLAPGGGAQLLPGEMQNPGLNTNAGDLNVTPANQFGVNPGDPLNLQPGSLGLTGNDPLNGPPLTAGEPFNNLPTDSQLNQTLPDPYATGTGSLTTPDLSNSGFPTTGEPQYAGTDNYYYNPSQFDPSVTAGQYASVPDAQMPAVSGSPDPSYLSGLPAQPSVPPESSYMQMPGQLSSDQPSIAYPDPSFAAQASAAGIGDPGSVNYPPAPAPDSYTTQYETGNWSTTPAQPPAVTYSDQGLTTQIPTAGGGDLNYNLGSPTTDSPMSVYNNVAPTPDLSAPSFNTTVYPDSGVAGNYNIAPDSGSTANYNVAPDPSFAANFNAPDPGLTTNYSADSSNYSNFGTTPPNQTVFDNSTNPVFDNSTNPVFNNPPAPVAPPDVNYQQNPDVNYQQNYAGSPTPDAGYPNPVAPIAPPEQVYFADATPPTITPAPIDSPMIIPMAIPVNNYSAPEPVYAPPPEPVYAPQQVAQTVTPEPVVVPPAVQAPPPAPVVHPQTPPLNFVAMTPPPPPSSAAAPATPAPTHEAEELPPQTQRSSLQEILAGLALQRRYRKRKPGDPNEPPPPSSLV